MTQISNPKWQERLMQDLYGKERALPAPKLFRD